MPDLEDTRYELLFDVRRSRRYHLWRVRLFQRWNAIRMLLFLAATSSVVAALFATMKDPLLLKVLASASALFAAAEMVLRLGHREVEHRAFAQQYVALERDIEAKGSELSESDLAAFRAAYLEIEVDEPPVLPMLNRICTNQQIQADHGKNAHEFQKPIPWLIQVWARIWYQAPMVHPRK